MANRASLDFTHPRIISDTFARLKETRRASLPFSPCFLVSRAELVAKTIQTPFYASPRHTSARLSTDPNNHGAHNFQALELSRESPHTVLFFVRFGKRNGNAIKSCNRAGSQADETVSVSR